VPAGGAGELHLVNDVSPEKAVDSWLSRVVALVPVDPVGVVGLAANKEADVKSR
jgi:hypothetical protein